MLAAPRKARIFKHEGNEGHKGKTFGFYSYSFVYLVAFVFKSFLPQVGLSEVGELHDGNYPNSPSASGNWRQVCKTATRSPRSHAGRTRWPFSKNSMPTG